MTESQGGDFSSKAGFGLKTPFSMLLPSAAAAARKRFSALEIMASSLRRRWDLRHRTEWFSESSGSVIFFTSTRCSSERPGRASKVSFSKESAALDEANHRYCDRSE